MVTGIQTVMSHEEATKGTSKRNGPCKGNETSQKVTLDWKEGRGPQGGDACKPRRLLSIPSARAR